jgi:hypothetical protein
MVSLVFIPQPVVEPWRMPTAGQAMASGTLPAHHNLATTSTTQRQLAVSPRLIATSPVSTHPLSVPLPSLRDVGIYTLCHVIASTTKDCAELPNASLLCYPPIQCNRPPPASLPLPLSRDVGPLLSATHNTQQGLGVQPLMDIQQ